MAGSSQGPRLTSVSAATPNREPQPRVVRLGQPANDNGVRAPLIIRALGVAMGAALAFLALRWLEIF
jgi:hypothetical protein